MATKLTALRFDQAANLVDDPANPHAKITLFKRVTKSQPAASAVHVDSTDWLKKDAEFFATRRKADVDYLTEKRRSKA
jgi:hypothetical protein